MFRVLFCFDVLTVVLVNLLIIQVNRDPMSNEMQKMRQQLEYLQAELLSARAGASSDEVLVTLATNHKPYLFYI